MKFRTAKRSFEFTVEKSETFTVRRITKTVAVLCDTCGRETEMSKPDTAAEITGISTRKIYSGIESGNVHFTESADGSLMVCLRSMGVNQAGSQLSEGELDQP